MRNLYGRWPIRSSFPLFDRYIPTIALMIIVIPLVLLAANAFGRMLLAISSTDVFVFSISVVSLLGVALYMMRWPLLLQTTNEVTFPIKLKGYSSGVLCALSGAMWALWNSHVGTSPLFVFFLSIALALIAMEVLASTSKKATIYILVQILIVGALLRAAPYYLNPYVYASDTYLHFTMVQTTTSSSHFVGIDVYAYYPAYHIFNSMGVELSGLPPSTFAIIDLMAIILSLVLVFAIGRRFISGRVGLLSALFLVMGNFYFPSASYQPTFLGMVPLMGAILALSLRYSGGSRATWVAFWTSAMATLLIHPIDFLILILVLGGGFLALIRARKAPRVTSMPLWSTVVVFIGYLLYVSLFLFSRIVLGIFAPAEFEPTGLAPNIVRGGAILSVYTSELFYANLGIAAKFVLLLPGILILLARRNLWHNWLALATVLVIAVPFVGLLLGAAENFQLTRSLLYMDLLIVFPLAAGFNGILSANPIRWKQALAAATVFTLAFTSLTSYITVDTGGFLTDAVPVQPYYIDGAGLSAHEFLEKIPPGANLSMDWGSAQYLAADPNRGPYQVPARVLLFNARQSVDGYVAVSFVTASRGGFTANGLEKIAYLSWTADAEGNPKYDKIFDSGTFVVLVSN